jgi:hypothetical protein
MGIMCYGMEWYGMWFLCNKAWYYCVIYDLEKDGVVYIVCYGMVYVPTGTFEL